MLRRRRGPKTVREGSLAVTAIAVGALMLSSPAAAEPAKAGPFYKSGMQAMWDIGLLLPADRDNRIQIRSCRIGKQRAICRLQVAVNGLGACPVTAVLTRGEYRLPAGRWGCPDGWRPVFIEWGGLPTEQLVMRKATRPAR